MRAIKSVLKFDNTLYNPESGALTPNQVKNEYNRLKSIAVKRIARLKAAGYGETQVVRYNENSYKSASEYSNIELQYKLYELSKFTESKASTVTGWKEINRKRISALHDVGADFVDESNIMQWGEYFVEWKNRHLDEQYTSTAVAEMARKTLGKVDWNTVKADFEHYLAGKGEENA